MQWQIIFIVIMEPNKGAILDNVVLKAIRQINVFFCGISAGWSDFRQLCIHK